MTNTQNPTNSDPFAYELALAEALEAAVCCHADDFDVATALDVLFGWEDEDTYLIAGQLADEIAQVRSAVSFLVVWAALSTGQDLLTDDECAAVDHAVFVHLLAIFVDEGAPAAGPFEAFVPQRLTEMQSALGDLGAVVRSDLAPVCAAVELLAPEPACFGTATRS